MNQQRKKGLLLESPSRLRFPAFGSRFANIVPERLRRKRESNRKYMKKIREKSKEFAEHERIAEEKSSDSNVCVEQNATSKSNRQKVKGEKIA